MNQILEIGLVSFQVGAFIIAVVVFFKEIIKR